LHLSMSIFLSFALATICWAQNQPSSSWEQYYGADMECFQDTAGTYANVGDYGGQAGWWWCCGITANGERACAPSNEWSMPKTGKFALCENSINADGGIKGNKDLCCTSSLVDNCDTCHAFVVWEFETQQEMEDSSKTTLDTNWRESFEDQDLNERDSYDNQVYPGGYSHARLRQGNDPPVCVYIPNAGGKVIEIKVEPDEQGNRLCISDLHDDQKDRNDPGQITSCDESMVKTCFPDGADTTSGSSGVAFYIECDTTCEEQTDVFLWYRVRTSDGTWQDNGNNGASNNIEMWCDQVGGEYPDWDIVPSDLAPQSNQLNLDPENASAALSLLFVCMAVLFAF